MHGRLSAARPCIFRLQFSLRVLLVALSLFAIGFPIWYRWPYQEINEERDTTGFVTSKSVLHWQRQWGGGTLLHGKREDHQYWVFGKTLVTTTNYVRGKRHGPYTTRSKVRPNVTGQYVDDMREGKWTIEYAWMKATLNYCHDKLDGTSTIELPAPQKKQTEMTVVFDAGKLISFNGQPVQDRLARSWNRVLLMNAPQRFCEHTRRSISWRSRS